MSIVASPKIFFPSDFAATRDDAGAGLRIQ